MRLRTIALAGLVGLSGCTPTTPTRATTLADGALLLQAPDGYCVDPVTSRPARDFAVLAPCATLGAEAPVPGVVGLITVQGGGPQSGAIVTDEAALRDFLVTDAGRALLSGTQNAGDIRVLTTQAFGDQVMVHFSDSGAPPLEGLQSEEWRAFLNAGGRLVTIAVRGLASAPLQDGPGATLLKQAIAGVRLASAAPAS